MPALPCIVQYYKIKILKGSSFSFNSYTFKTQISTWWDIWIKFKKFSYFVAFKKIFYIDLKHSVITFKMFELY